MEGSPDNVRNRVPEDPPTVIVSEDEPIIEHRVSFFPILSEQRKLWLLTHIREERVTSLLDVGCGEGSLLWSLSNPAYWLPDTLPGFVYAHVRTLHGLDISAESLDYAKGAIQPTPPSPYSLPRWEPLSASLWRGGLQKVNDEFKGIECIVASEVIEHLPPGAFAAFAPVLLGCYAPRLLLLTTPSYSFNRLFIPPPPSTPGREDPWLTWGWPSPTQPGRRMRHDDHQFEWTPAEAKEWCTAVGEAWGYDFKLGGVGIATVTDPWGRTIDDDNDAGGRASLVVEFRRRKGEEADARRKTAWAAWCQGEGAEMAEEAPHEQVEAIEHVAHEQGGKPRSHEEIADSARQAIRERRSASARLCEIWSETATVCGGSRVALVEALDADPRFRIDKDILDAQRWEITLLGEEGELAKNWEEPVVEVQEHLDPEQSDEYEEYDEDVEESGLVGDDDTNVAADGEVSAWGAAESEGGWGGWDTTDANYEQL
ncbi:unnamed protein product [Peniophora sp. CBMAI 1063]|nr:unnamed protein product [Peniophora sp. CBMAI 1063]